MPRKKKTKKYSTKYEDIIANQARLRKEKDREIKRHVRRAYKTGVKVPYSLDTLIRLNFSLKVIRSVYRNR